jgi:2-hydroxychromene-2-carboxylate isomerase
MPMAGSSTADSPEANQLARNSPGANSRGRVFYFDLSSPWSWLAAERVLHVVEQPCEWVPVDLAYEPAFRCAEEEASLREDVERAAAAQGLPAVRWPDPFPFDASLATRAAWYAKGGGKTVGFALAALRQVFNGGRSLEDPDTVLLAGAAVEIHPRALLVGADTEGTKRRVAEATGLARERGVTETPALWVEGRGVLDVPALSAA